LKWADLTYIHSIGLPLFPDHRAPRVMKVVGDAAWERAIRLNWIAPTEDIDAFQTDTYALHAEMEKRSRARNAQSMDRIIVPSNYLKRMVVGWGVPEERVRVVYNALSPQSVAQRSALSQQDARAALKLPEGPLLLSVARLTAWKGIGPLIKVVADTPDVRLVVAGDGPLLGELQAQAAASGAGDRITLLGRVPREQVAVLMRAADYTVLYSGYEGLSHTLLESLHAGTPVIASDKGGNPEVVLPGVNGYLVPYVDQEALTETVRAALRPGVREKLAAGTGKGMERFTWARMVNDTLASLEEVAR
jgi:glycosyltransferase involved in cell wall biosynthesis